ncbi:hypothetical protein AB0H42_15680 [Nocardia sp. NPDC050799]|uniref:hypothetical protein n=1 Tax=Nocardia sp. NPDC050799 TaxID=3154842 RepID=UPI0033EE5DE1
MADLMLVFTIGAGIVGPIVGISQHSWWPAGLLGGIGAPTFTAYRRLEHKARSREESADNAEDRAFDRRARRLELEARAAELDRLRQEFEFGMRKRRRELTNVSHRYSFRSGAREISFSSGPAGWPDTVRAVAAPSAASVEAPPDVLPQ